MGESDYRKVFAQNLKHMLDVNNLSQVELARKLGVHESTVSYWLSAEKSPRMSKVDAMCDIFGCTRSQLTLPHSETEYYLNPETQKIGQEIYENKDLRLLFDAARNASPEDLKTAHDVLKALKAKEQGDYD